MKDMPIKFEALKDLNTAIQNKMDCSVFGLSLGEKSFFLSQQNRQIVFVTNSIADSNKLLKQFESFGKKTAMLFFAQGQYFSMSSTYSENDSRNVDTLYQLLKNKIDVLIVSPLSLIQKYPKKELFKKSIITLKQGKSYSITDLGQNLSNMGYNRVDMVENQGEFSIRGDIVDIFCFSNQNPTRIEFFDDEIESVNEYDIVTYKKIKSISSIEILPKSIFIFDQTNKNQVLTEITNAFEKTAKKMETNEAVKLRTNFEEFKVNFDANNYEYTKNWFIPYCEFDKIQNYLDDNAMFVFDDVKQIYDAIKNEYADFYALYDEMLKTGEAIVGQDKFLIDREEVFDIGKQKISFQQITTSNRIFEPTFVASYKSMAETNYFGNYELLVEDLRYYLEFKNTVCIFAGSKQLAEYLDKYLKSKQIDCQFVSAQEIEKNKVNILDLKIPYGAIFVEDKLVFIGQEELQKKKVENKIVSQSKKDEFTLPKIGDFVVHETYGIGQCVGLEKLKFSDYQKEYIILQYDKGDKVYLPTEQIGLISTYVSNGTPPKLNKLGSKDFENTKAKVKNSLKELAFSLIELYSQREKQKGFRFELDKKMYQEFENSFPYEETADQLSAMEDIIHDMTTAKIMDRIVCGDVGYGKTEVAIRTAFIAALNNKQVAFLAPTTILSEQHFNTAKSRLQNFGIEVECLNRFKTKAEQKEILKRLKEGKIDVICGTHRLLSKDVEFKDLGLLVLDEEQRFGVSDKEKIKTIKNNVAVLTLSATPIPRTLHMGLVGIRDISLITTPPKSRMPVQTTVAEFSNSLVLQAINRELARDGQVLIIYNRVETIRDFANKIKAMVGDKVSVSFAHGQMDSDELENEIFKLYNGETKILVSTTLIENGIDLPNANTLIIVDADKLGLSQLYQLKGRVGRGKNLGYAYFTYDKDKMLSSDAYKRLNAIMEFTELGSGFKIAMKDLEIRGCGNILGPEQSGHMAKVGYDMYCKILNEAVSEIKGQKVKEYKDIKIDIAINCFIPESYIQASDERFKIYNKLKQIGSSDKKQKILNEIEGIYGEVPQEITNLANVALLRNCALEFEVKRISIDRNRCQAEFYEKSKMLDENIRETLKQMDIKNYFSNTGIVMNFALSEFSIKKKLEILSEIFEKSLLTKNK